MSTNTPEKQQQCVSPDLPTGPSAPSHHERKHRQDVDPSLTSSIGRELVVRAALQQSSFWEGRVRYSLH